MSSLLGFQIRQQQQQKSTVGEESTSGLPSPPNSFCGDESSHPQPLLVDNKRRDSLQTVFNDMSIKDYSTSLPENYTIDHSTNNKKASHAPIAIATATAAATGGLTIRNRRQSDANSVGAGPRRKSRALSESLNNLGQYKCHDCGKSYKHPNCLQKHRWEHSEEWEVTKKLSLTKHQQVQMLEAAAILIGMDRRVETNTKHEKVEREDDEESIVVDDEDVEEEEEDQLSVTSDSSSIFMEDL